jgi:hypothetical protein
VRVAPGSAHDRFVLGVVSRVVGVKQHPSSLELSQHPRLHAAGHLRDLALGGRPSEQLDGRDHTGGSLSDPTFLAEAS